MDNIPQKMSIRDTYGKTITLKNFRTLIMDGLTVTYTVGASYIGVIIAAALYGLTTLQVYFYYVYYPKDRLGLKLLVYVIWIIDTLHMAAVAYCIYYYLVINYNNPPALAFGHWTLFASVAMSISMAVIGRCYFTQKIYALCPRKFKVPVTVVIGLTIIAYLVLGMTTVVLLFINNELARFAEIRFTAFTPFVTMGVLADHLIAVALCILLWGNKPNFKSVAGNTIISTLIVYAINRCLLTSFVASAGLITALVSPQSLWFLALSFIIAKLYANSLLATLNSRRSVRNITHDTVNTVHLSQLEFQQSSTSCQESQAQRDQIEVNLRYEPRTDEDRLMPGSKTQVSSSFSDASLARMAKV